MWALWKSWDYDYDEIIVRFMYICRKSAVVKEILFCHSTSEHVRGTLGCHRCQVGRCRSKSLCLCIYLLEDLKLPCFGCWNFFCYSYYRNIWINVHLWISGVLVLLSSNGRIIDVSNFKIQIFNKGKWQQILRFVTSLFLKILFSHHLDIFAVDFRLVGGEGKPMK